MQDEVSNEETLLKLGALQHEIAKAYDYAQGEILNPLNQAQCDKMQRGEIL